MEISEGAGWGVGSLKMEGRGQEEEESAGMWRRK